MLWQADTRNTTISRSVKKIIIHFLIIGLNGLFSLLKSFFNFSKTYIARPFMIVAIPLMRVTIIPLYNVLLKANKVLDRLIGPVKNKYLVPFLNRYVTHAIVLIITVLIVFLNYQVQETRAESFGERSILFALVKGADFGDYYIEETVTPTDAATSYFGSDFIMPSGTQQFVTPDNPIVSSEEQSNFATLVQGDAVAPTGITSVEASKTKRDKIVNYVVKSGDTVSGIAAKFGLTTNSILWANNMTARSYLKPGQNLDIPPTDGIVYTVKSGDSVNALAKKYDAEVDDIIEFNKLASASDITSGQILMLPGGKPYRAPAPIQPTKIAPVQQIFEKPKVDTNADGLIWPTTTRRISQYYHWAHTALDIDGEFGDMIWAASDGVVTTVQHLNWGYGYYVIIDHGGGTHTLYAHFQRIYVQQGQKVAQGDILGEMGSTGRSTGSHLHFEVRVGGKRLNPFAWVTGY